MCGQRLEVVPAAGSVRPEEPPASGARWGWEAGNPPHRAVAKPAKAAAQHPPGAQPARFKTIASIGASTTELAIEPSL